MECKKVVLDERFRGLKFYAGEFIPDYLLKDPKPAASVKRIWRERRLILKNSDQAITRFEHL
jgi:hypothetical protein